MVESTKVYGRQKRLKTLFLEQMRKTPIISLVSEKTGIPRSTYYRWIKEDTDFGVIAQEIYTEGVGGLNDMATSQLMKLVKEGDRNSIFFWLRMRDPEFGGIITRMKKPEGMAGLSKEKRDILKQLFERREAVYNDMMERKNNINNNGGNPNYGDNSEGSGNIP